MTFVLSLSEIRGAEKVGGIYVRGNEYYKDGKNMLLKKGEIFNYDNDKEVFRCLIEEGMFLIQKLKGEFFLVCYNNNSRKIYIANDKLGRETLFYFYDEKKFILSDDFWEIVNLIQPSASDIDVQNVKEFVMFYYPLFHKTIIKNLNFFPPASIGVFSLADRTFEIKQYWDFRLQADDNLSIEEAVEKIDSALDSAMKQIKEKNNPSATYGLGLSGGLDSRLIPYYARKHNMSLKSFIIGERRPHKFILSRDHKSARELAKYYKLNHREVEYDSESFENKMFYDVRYFPMGSSNFFISVRKDIPAFDILLTGASGYLVGSVIPENLYDDKLSKDDLVNLVIKGQSAINPPIRVSSRLRRGLELIFRLPEHYRQSIKGIISENEFAEAVNKIRQFVDAEYNSDKSNFEIYFKYFHHIGAKNKYGTYESLNGYKKAYTYYYPFLFEEILTWKPEFFKTRALLEYLIIKKHPELSKIQGTNWNVPLFYKNKKVSIFGKPFTVIMYLFRGLGNDNLERWANKRDYKEYSKKKMLKRNTIFKSMFDAKDIIKLVESDNISFLLYTQIVKLKQILDLIETKDYKDFFNKDKKNENEYKSIGD